MILDNKFFLGFSLIFIVFTIKSQGLSSKPDLDGDLDIWFSSVSGENFYPFLEGSYYFISEGSNSRYEHPFYQSIWTEGSLVYEGRKYQDVTMAYNIVKDVLLIWNWDMKKGGEKSLLIDQNKVDSFVIHNDKFVGSTTLGMGDGYHQEIHHGDSIGCYAKRYKLVEINQRSTEYTNKSDLIILYKGRMYNYRGKSTLFKIFPEYKKDIKRYIRKNIASYSRRNDDGLRQVLAYCESLMK